LPSNTFASKMKNVCWGIKQKSETEKKLLVLNKIIETQLFHSQVLFRYWNKVRFNYAN